MKDTKRKIIQATIDLFNEHGCTNVSLPQIARHLSISLGNLTYHFPKKDQLMWSVYDTFRADLADITSEYQSMVDLEDIDRQLREFYHFQKKYRFFYLDPLAMNRSYPEIAKDHHPYVEGHIQGVFNYFIYNVGSGNLKSVDDISDYKRLAHRFWMTAAFWPMQLAFRGKIGNQKEMLASVWELIAPYFTKKGKEKYKHFALKNTKAVKKSN